MSLKRKQYTSKFTLIGVPKVKEGTFKMNQVNKKSTWKYSSMFLNIDCGERHGSIACELMGGYSIADNKTSILYKYGKKEDGSADFENRMEIDWEDRFNENIIKECADNSFITIGIEKTKDGSPYYKKFLSEYDAIEYLHKYLTADECKNMVVKVNGNLVYSEYNNQVRVSHRITSIRIIDKEPKDFTATFRQSILLTSKSATKNNLDEKGKTLFVDGKVLEYRKFIGDKEYKSQYPYPYTFEYNFSTDNEIQRNKIMDKLFKVEPNTVTQINFNGEIVASGSTVEVTYDDLTDDIKELIECGIYTEEEALKECADNSSFRNKMVLKTPIIQKTDEGNVVQVFKEMFEEKDLNIDVDELKDVNTTNSATTTNKSDTTSVSETKANEDDDDLAFLDDLI